MKSFFREVLENYSENAYENLKNQQGEMEVCREIFAGNPPWRQVKKGGLYSGGGKRKMFLMNAGKVLAEEFSALIFSEGLKISVDDPLAEAFVTQVLEENSFWEQFPRFLTQVFAMGNGVLKVYAEDGFPSIDYVEGGNFIPLAWNSGGVFEGVFLARTFVNDNFFTLVEHHYYEENVPKVAFKLHKSDSKFALGKEIPLSQFYGELPESVAYDFGDKISMFTCFSTNGGNFLDYDCPLGISIFSAAKDTLQALDIAFDSLTREFVLGKKRIIVPSACVRTVVDPESGVTTRYFDPDDEVYVALKCDEDNDLNIKDNTTELRIDEHIKAITALLKILAFQVGISPAAFSIDDSRSIKTATEIISADHKTMRTVKMYKNTFEKSLKNVINGLIKLGIGLNYLENREYSVSVNFFDNIIVDDNTNITNNIRLVQAGLRSKTSAIRNIEKCNSDFAESELSKIITEN